MFRILPRYMSLIFRTLLPGRNSCGRLTGRRAAVMSLFLPAFIFLQLLHGIGFLLDELLFRGYRRVEIKAPLFIVGIPRSGTTFLHRVLAEDQRQFTTFTLWELLLAPSVAERKFWQSVAWIDRRIGGWGLRALQFLEKRGFGGWRDVHGTALTAPEEDYLVLAPILACFLLILPFPSLAEIWNLAYFDQRIPARERRAVMAFYRACLQRHLYVHGPDKRLLSKNPAFSPMIESLGAAFPDCRIICTLRNPIEAIPSHLSSMAAGARIFDNGDSEEFQRRLVNMMKHFYRHLTRTLPRWPENRQVLVCLEALKRNLHPIVADIYHRFGLQLSPAFEAVLQREHRRSLTYCSTHAYSLAQFHLQTEDIVSGIEEVFAQFQFDAEPQPHLPQETT
jgi:hypothetical protein